MYSRSLRRSSPHLIFLLTAILADGNEEKTVTAHGHHTDTAINVFHVSVPDHPFDLILSRPEKNFITASVLTYNNAEGFLTYCPANSTVIMQTPLRQFKKGESVEILLSGLQADTRYRYQLNLRTTGSGSFTRSQDYSFHTARPPGGTFCFTLSADVHLDEHTSSAMYERTLANILADQPDFHLDLGNLFMTDKHANRDEAASQYLAQRYYLGRIGCSIPVLLALGTHDGENAKYDDGSTDCLAVWSNRMRERLFPNPVPDLFYTGSNVPHPHSGLLQNYYAWEWGDVLFVVLDPFRYSTRQHGGGDGWGWSLGATQYQWLAQTLEQSRAKVKFVLIHNLLCGDQAARGGIEVAAFNEWGGKNSDGSDGFKAHRPGWPEPIHKLLLRHHVTAVFKAHDNFYARQELDGIIYLMIPQPSFAGNDRIRDLDTYGYKQGVFLGNSGHVRVTVTPDHVTLDYVRALLPIDETDTQKNGAIASLCELAIDGTKHDSTPSASAPTFPRSP